MNIGDIINAIKEFFLDILGYLLPGCFFIAISSLIISEKYKFGVYSLGLDKEWLFGLLLFWGYLLGYVVYSFSDYSDKLVFRMTFRKIKTVDEIETDIANSDQFNLCKIVVAKLISDSQLAFTPTNTFNSPRNLRSVIMSYIPEADIKIYTFTFRSEICKNVGSSCIFLSILILLSIIIDFFFKTDILMHDRTRLFIVLLLLILSSSLLVKTRMRFYSIAQRIPFSIFIAKYFKIP